MAIRTVMPITMAATAKAGPTGIRTNSRLGILASTYAIIGSFGLGKATKIQGGRDQTDALLKGFTIAMPSISRPCCKSSDSRTLQPACWAVRRTRASQKENACNRCRSIAARMSGTWGTATSNSARSSTLRRATWELSLSFRVTVTKYSWRTCNETTPVPFRRCSYTRSRARRCLAGASSSSA